MLSLCLLREAWQPKVSSPHAISHFVSPPLLFPRLPLPSLRLPSSSPFLVYLVHIVLVVLIIFSITYIHTSHTFLKTSFYSLEWSFPQKCPLLPLRERFNISHSWREKRKPRRSSLIFKYILVFSLLFIIGGCFY